MATEFLRRTVQIPRGRGRRTFNDGGELAGRVVRAQVALNGFKLDYIDDDHHINIVEVDVDIVSVNNRSVEFQVEVQYADKNFDDEYQGYIDVLIIADTNLP
jgi:hypothetical protein